MSRRHLRPIVIGLAFATAFIAGRVTSPERGVTWSEAETLVCTPLELQHTPAAEFSL